MLTCCVQPEIKIVYGVTLSVPRTLFLSVQCNVQHWTEYKTTLASVRPSVHPSIRPSVRPVSVQTAITAKIVSLEVSFGPIFTKFGRWLPLNIPKKIFSQQCLKWAWPWSSDPLNFWALNANDSQKVKAADFKFYINVSKDSPDMTP